MAQKQTVIVDVGNLHVLFPPVPDARASGDTIQDMYVNLYKPLAVAEALALYKIQEAGLCFRAKGVPPSLSTYMNALTQFKETVNDAALCDRSVFQHLSVNTLAVAEKYALGDMKSVSLKRAFEALAGPIRACQIDVGCASYIEGRSLAISFDTRPAVEYVAKILASDAGQAVLYRAEKSGIAGEAARQVAGWVTAHDGQWKAYLAKDLDEMAYSAKTIERLRAQLAKPSVDPATAQIRKGAALRIVTN